MTASVLAHAPHSNPAYLCRCLKVTEQMLIEAIHLDQLETLDQVRACTGAGDGCTACCKRIHKILQRELARIEAASRPSLVPLPVFA